MNQVTSDRFSLVRIVVITTVLSLGAGASFALETTLRSTITFEQAKLAREHGFRVSMFYVALDSVERHIERVMRRAARGGSLGEREHAAKNPRKQPAQSSYGSDSGQELDRDRPNLR